MDHRPARIYRRVRERPEKARADWNGGEKCRAAAAEHEARIEAETRRVQAEMERPGLKRKEQE